jgi:AcrR family transcriptional regulator
MMGSDSSQADPAASLVNRKQGSRRRYHHGDLRTALLEAAEAELAEKGIEGFTLRGCARRAGVSHAAPAHHFADANALLTALAARGFDRFLGHQQSRRANADNPREKLVLSGLAYIEFALAYPDLFRLMFASKRIDFSDPVLQKAASASFTDLVEQVAAVTGRQLGRNPGAEAEVGAVWSMVHGLSDLLLAGRMKFLHAMSDEQRSATVDAIIRKVVF